MSSSPSKAPLRPLSAGSLRAEVRAWAHVHCASQLSLREWRERLLESGWAVPSWPRRWFGQGLPAWADDVVYDDVVYEDRSDAHWRAQPGDARAADARAAGQVRSEGPRSPRYRGRRRRPRPTRMRNIERDLST